MLSPCHSEPVTDVTGVGIRPLFLGKRIATTSLRTGLAMTAHFATRPSAAATFRADDIRPYWMLAAKTSCHSEERSDEESRRQPGDPSLALRMTCEV